MQQLNLTMQFIVLLILFTISPFHCQQKCVPKKGLTIGKFHHINITLYNDFAISPFGKRKKALHHFTPKPYWHIPIIHSYHHFTISWFHHFTNSPFNHSNMMLKMWTHAVYKKEKWWNNFFSRITKISLLIPTSTVVEIKKTTKQTILLQKRRHEIFRNSSKSQIK